MSWTAYRLIPEDVLFFREAKPSSIGDDHYLRSIFPPFPSTLYGLTRTQRLLQEGCDLSAVSSQWWQALPDELRRQVGEWGEYGSLQLRGPWLLRTNRRGSAEDDEILLPAPLDLRIHANAPENADEPRTVTSVARLLPVDRAREKKSWSHPFAPMSPSIHSESAGAFVPIPPSRHEAGLPPTKLDSPIDWFLKMNGVERWMDGGTPLPEHFVDSRSLWRSEIRTGVGLQKERRSNESGMLYTFGFVRLAPGVSIGFELEGGALQPECYVRLGGENRLARLEHGPSLTGQIDAARHTAGGDGVYTLLAPAIYPNGSYPEASVIAAVVADAGHVGGWDLAKRGPKRLQRAVPAGSVYWIDNGPGERLGSLSQQNHEGFGLMLRGNRPGR